MTDDQIRRQIWIDIWSSRGSAPNEVDYTYWVGKWSELVARGIELGNPNYADQRVLGMGAGGADVPPFGPYATPPTAAHPVPPYPGDVSVPTPIPMPLPLPDFPPAIAPWVTPQQLAESEARILARIDKAATDINTSLGSIRPIIQALARWFH